MASVNTSEIPVEQQFFGDLWNYRKKYYRGEDRDEFWSMLVDDANQLSKKYNNGYFDQMLIVCVDDIERRWKITTGNPFINPDPLRTLYEKLRKE